MSKKKQKEFAECYIGRFMETMVLGCSGGLYGDVIEENHGIFELDVVHKFIRFQHGDNDYHYYFRDDEILDDQRNLCKCFLKLVDSVWCDKEHYTNASPNLIKNTTESFKKIILTFA